MATPIRVYVPSEPTGLPPADLRGMNNIQLVGVVKDRADFLTETGRMHLITADDVLHLANHRLKHALNIIVRNCRATYEQRDQLKTDYDLLDRQYNLVKKQVNSLDETLKGLERKLADASTISDNLRDANHDLQRDSDTFQALRNKAINERNQARNELNRVRADYTRAVGERNDAQNALNRSTLLLNNWRQRAIRNGGQLNQVNQQLRVAQFTTRQIGRIRDRLQQRIAALRIQVQWFRIRQLNPPPPPLNNPPETIWLPLV
jgi:chromosome segregation ATPase